MRTAIMTLALAALTGAPLAVTGAPTAPPPTPTPQTAPETSVDSEQLDTFTSIYVEMQDARSKLSNRMANAESPEDAQKIQRSMDQKFNEVIEAHGWDLEEYNEVASAINSNPDLRQRALSMINEKS